MREPSDAIISIIDDEGKRQNLTTDGITILQNLVFL